MLEEELQMRAMRKRNETKRTGCSSLRMERDSSSLVTVDVRSEIAATAKQGKRVERQKRKASDAAREEERKGNSQDGVRRLSQPSSKSELIAKSSGGAEEPGFFASEGGHSSLQSARR